MHANALTRVALAAMLVAHIGCSPRTPGGAATGSENAVPTVGADASTDAGPEKSPVLDGGAQITVRVLLPDPEFHLPESGMTTGVVAHKMQTRRKPPLGLVPSVVFSGVGVFQENDDTTLLGEIELQPNGDGTARAAVLPIQGGRYRLVGTATREDGTVLTGTSEVVDIADRAMSSVAVTYLATGQPRPTGPRVTLLSIQQPTGARDQAPLTIVAQVSIPQGKTATAMVSAACFNEAGESLGAEISTPSGQHPLGLHSSDTSVNWTLVSPGASSCRATVTLALKDDPNAVDTADIDLARRTLGLDVNVSANLGIRVLSATLLSNLGASTAHIPYDLRETGPYQWVLHIDNPFIVADEKGLALKAATLKISGEQCVLTPSPDTIEPDLPVAEVPELTSATNIRWTLRKTKAVSLRDLKEHPQCILSYTLTDSMNVTTVGSVSIPISGQLSAPTDAPLLDVVRGVVSLSWSRGLGSV